MGISSPGFCAHECVYCEEGMLRFDGVFCCHRELYGCERLNIGGRS